MDKTLENENLENKAAKVTTEAEQNTQPAEKAQADDIMISCDNLVKIYKTDEIEVVALQGLDLEVKRGELMAIVGNSGSGKSTLLNMLGGLDKPSAGALTVDGKNLLRFTDKDYVDYKLNTVGFVWQNNARNLVPYLTAVQNVELPMLLAKGKERRKRALKLLEMVGLSHRVNSRLDQMSGGEQQRVAIAISLANNPKLLLADEPTGAVDTKTSAMILDIFKKLNRELGITIVIVTHDVKMAKNIDRVVAIRDGRTSSEIVRKRSYVEMLSEQGEQIFVESDEEAVAEELIVLDRSGRLQLPREYLDKLGIRGGDKVKVEFDEQSGRISVFKSDDKKPE